MSFKKKSSTPATLPIDGPWSVVQGNYNGGVIFARINIGYREFGSVPGYIYQVGVAVPFNNSEPTGLPSSEESAELVEIEDVICGVLEEGAAALFVGVITTGDTREFVFYARDSKQVEARFEELRGRIASHEVQLMIQPDENWDVYAQLKTASIH
jgi:hypothetical protein